MTTYVTGAGGGGKGGGGSSTPTEAPDSLHSMSKARLVDLISEGEIEGLVDGLNSVFLDDTPLATNGAPNFEGINLNWRNGTQDQSSIPGFQTVENGQSVGVELLETTPWTRDFTNLEITTVRVELSVAQLQKVDLGSGDTGGYTVEYAIDISADGGPFREVLKRAFSGKTTSKYARSHDIVLPPATERRTLRVRRLTKNANSATTSDRTTVDSITEIVDGQFSYPNSAVIGLEVSSLHFQGVPRRAYHVRGLKVKVPDNYDPYTRAYLGVWQGGWKIAWTNNPAWIFMDLATNTRYGLGDRIPLGNIDKWQLMDIARYADQMVPDGFGGMEPRFTCNVQIVDRENAYDLLQKLASVFQGMAYYASGIVTAVADQPRDISTVYSNSDVVEGRFEYSGSPQSTRYTVAFVGWSNFQNFGKQEIEVVEDRAGYLRYGHQETQLTAFACSSQGQAHRVGKWGLLTSQVETQICQFSVGLKGLKSRPGDIIQVADQDLIGEMKGGLIAKSTLNSITTDCDFTAEVGNNLTVMLPSGLAEVRTIGGIAGRKVTVTANFSVSPQVQGTWAVDGAVKLQTFRVLGITEKEDGVTFEMKCLQYEPGKYDAIASGTKLDPRPITAIPPSVQPPPSNVRISQRVVVNQGIANTIATIAWDSAPNAVAYEGMWRRGEGEWVPFPRTGSQHVEISNIYSGRYIARVHAINALDIRSIAASSMETLLEGKNTPPPVVTFLTTSPVLWGIWVKWGMPQQGAEDVQRSELWFSVTPNREDATKLSDLAYPQSSYSHIGLKASQDFYYWVRLVDRSGNFGAFFPDGPGVRGSTSMDANEYLDAIRDEVLTTDLADQLINDKVSAAVGEAFGTEVSNLLEMSQLMDAAERHIREDETLITNRKVDVLEQEVTENISAAITDIREVMTTADGAMAQTLLTLEANVGDNQAVVTQKLTALSTADVAFAQSLTTLESKVTNEISASISELRQTVANADAALAQSITGLTSRVGTSEANITVAANTLATTNGKLSSLYTIKTSVTSGGQRYWAGIGLGVENNPNGPGFISQILLQADRVALLNTNGNGVTSPFAVQGGQVFMNSALIQDASITNAKIGGQIYSKNWVYGVSGWMLDVDGNFYANSGQFRGNLVAANGTFSGTLTADAINAVSTLNIAGQSVTVSMFNTVSTANLHPGGLPTFLPGTAVWSTSVYCPVAAVISVAGLGGLTQTYYMDGGADVSRYLFADGVRFSHNEFTQLGPGWHTITINLVNNGQSGGNGVIGNLSGALVFQMFFR